MKQVQQTINDFTKPTNKVKVLTEPPPPTNYSIKIDGKPMKDLKTLKLTPRQAFDKTVDILKAYESGDLHGGNPMQYIEEYALQELEKEREKAKGLAEAVEKFLKVINRSETALEYYGDAIGTGETALNNYK